MNGAGGADTAVRVVTARLPSCAPVQVEVTVPAGEDGLTSVGLRDLDLDHALDTIAEIGTLVVDKLKAAKPTKATVQLKLGFAVEAGKLTALWVGGKGEASLTVTLEWSGHPASDVGNNG
jgi:hypothetical protein